VWWERCCMKDDSCCEVFLTDHVCCCPLLTFLKVVSINLPDLVAVNPLLVTLLLAASGTCSIGDWWRYLSRPIRHACPKYLGWHCSNSCTTFISTHRSFLFTSVALIFLCVCVCVCCMISKELSDLFACILFIQSVRLCYFLAYLCCSNRPSVCVCVCCRG